MISDKNIRVTKEAIRLLKNIQSKRLFGRETYSDIIIRKCKE